MDNKYSEKEIAILNGMLELINNGANPHSITVSEIAVSAGVGKGTIYDYFKTKEEVISKSILFNLNSELDRFRLRVNFKESFEERFYEMLIIIEENMDNMFSSFNLFSSVQSFYQLHQDLIGQESDFIEYIKRVHQIIDELVDCGYKNNVIKKNMEGEQYPQMVIKSAFCAFIDCIALGKFKTIDREQAREYAYTIVIKSLN